MVIRLRLCSEETIKKVEGGSYNFHRAEDSGLIYSEIKLVPNLSRSQASAEAEG